MSNRARAKAMVRLMDLMKVHRGKPDARALALAELSEAERKLVEPHKEARTFPETVSPPALEMPDEDQPLPPQNRKKPCVHCHFVLYDTYGYQRLPWAQCTHSSATTRDERGKVIGYNWTRYNRRSPNPDACGPAGRHWKPQEVEQPRPETMTQAVKQRTAEEQAEHDAKIKARIEELRSLFIAAAIGHGMSFDGSGSLLTVGAFTFKITFERLPKSDKIIFAFDGRPEQVPTPKGWRRYHSFGAQFEREIKPDKDAGTIEQILAALVEQSPIYAEKRLERLGAERQAAQARERQRAEEIRQEREKECWQQLVARSHSAHELREVSQYLDLISRTNDHSVLEFVRWAQARLEALDPTREDVVRRLVRLYEQSKTAS